MKMTNNLKTLTFLIVFIIAFLLMRNGSPMLTGLVKKVSEGGGAIEVLLIPGAIIIVVWIFLAQALKSIILKALPREQRFVPTSPEAFSWLNIEEIERYTDEMKNLGFTHLTDYTIDADYSTKMAGFARLLVHEKEHCFTEINQIQPEGMPATPVRAVILSRLTDGWSLSSTDRKADAISILIGRRPKGLWISRPGQKIADIHREHLKLRDTITRDLGVKPIKESGQEYYFRATMQNLQQQREIVRTMLMPFEMASLFAFILFPVTEWMGAYRQKK